MKSLKKLTSVLLAVVLCLGLAVTGVFAGTSDPGTGTATLGAINEIDATDALIELSDIAAVSGQNAIRGSDDVAGDNLTYSTVNSNTPVFWSANVTAVTKPGGAASDATVRDYIYWSEASGNTTYPACIDVKDAESGCTVTVDWTDAADDILPSGTGSKHARFTVKYHLYDAATNTAASTANYTVVFATDNSTVYVKEGDSDYHFTSANSTDLDTDATALTVSAGTGQTNYVTGVIGDSGATYVLSTLVTTGGSEQVIFALGKKFAFSEATQTQDFFALADMPNLAAAGDYTWTITVTTAKWNVN